jgi:NAD(P)-dependent dehydrogenase (short-subunit alcohol dehydrogenase family)
MVTRAERWTAAQIPDQARRIVVVTGANSGIGLETARVLAEHGAHVVLACRTRAKAERARLSILEGNPSGEVELVDLDLASLTSVRAAAAEIGERFDRLDLLIDNAGVMATPRGCTVDGFETQFGTNHLGHFALTGLLLPMLLATPASRVVSVSSLAHRIGTIHFNDLQSERGYHRWRAYGQSKLANLLFIAELQRRLSAAGAPTIAVAAHPGGANTNLTTSTGGLGGRLAALTKPVMGAFMQSAYMGALPTLRAAVDPAVQGGEYFGPGGFMEQRGFPEEVHSSARAYDLGVAARLWDVSESLTGVAYPLDDQQDV